MDHTVEILHTRFVTHDVKQFVMTRPVGMKFEPGQGVEIEVPGEKWEGETRPFTPTSDPAEPVLELTIKEYPEKEGVTRELHRLPIGHTLRMSEAFGTITYQGPGLFVAGGAGITPFLSIVRTLDGAELDECSLLFSNKTPADVICEKELRHLFGDRCHLICTEKSAAGYDDRRIDRAMLEEKVGSDLDRHFYVCGPPGLVDDVTSMLGDIGVASDAIVTEG